MTFKVEFSFTSIDELQEFISTKTSTATTTPIPERKTVEVSKEKPLKAPKGPKPDVPSAGQDTSPTGKKTDEKAKDKITYEYVKQATLDVVKAAGNSQAAKDILADFGAKTALELKESQWADYLKRCGEVLKTPVEKPEEELA